MGKEADKSPCAVQHSSSTEALLPHFPSLSASINDPPQSSVSTCTTSLVACDPYDRTDPARDDTVPVELGPIPPTNGGPTPLMVPAMLRDGTHPAAAAARSRRRERLSGGPMSLRRPMPPVMELLDPVGDWRKDRYWW